VPGGHRVVDRYYDPTTDQFLSVDPDVVETGQPYAYTGDDPLNATDPLGLMAPTEGDYRYLNHWRQHNQFCRRHPGIRGRSCAGLTHELRGTFGKVRHRIASIYDSANSAISSGWTDVNTKVDEAPGASFLASHATGIVSGAASIGGCAETDGATCAAYGAAVSGGEAVADALEGCSPGSVLTNFVAGVVGAGLGGIFKLADGATSGVFKDYVAAHVWGTEGLGAAVTACG